MQCRETVECGSGSGGGGFFALDILRPVAGVYPGVKVQTRRTRHHNWSQTNTLVIEAAVVRMRDEHWIAVLTLMADDIKLRVLVQ